MKLYIVIFLSLFFTNFFGATELNNKMFLVPIFIFTLIEFQKRSIFKWYFVAVLVGLAGSILSSYIFRDQPIALTFKASAAYFYIFFYFVLKYLDISIPKMEKAIFILAAIFCVSYIIQFIIYPKVIFAGALNENITTEDIRVRLSGQGLSSLGYFYGLNKFLQNNKRKYHLMLSIICFAVIFLMGFRTMLVMISAFSFILIFRLKGFNWKFLGYSLLICGIFIGSLQIPVFTQKIDSMLQRQDEQVLTNKEYVRVVQLYFFTHEHFQSPVEYVLGSGMTYNTKEESSNYGKYMESLTELGIFFDDWGLLGLSWIIGIIAVLAMIAYSVKSIFINVPYNYYYLGIWFIYILAISFTTREFYREGNFIVQAIALYVLEKIYFNYIIEEKNQIKIA